LLSVSLTRIVTGRKRETTIRLPLVSDIVNESESNCKTQIETRQVNDDKKNNS
jgi:hypothetical protein